MELSTVKERFIQIGTLEAWVRRNGSKEWEKVFNIPAPNLITNKGLAVAATSLTSASFPTYAAIGTGTTAAANGDTDLETEVDRQTGTPSTVQTAVAGDTAQWVSTHTAPAGGWAITEYGLDLDAVAATNIFNHVVFAAINLNENDQVQFTYKCQNQRV